MSEQGDHDRGYFGNAFDSNGDGHLDAGERANDTAQYADYMSRQDSGDGGTDYGPGHTEVWVNEGINWPFGLLVIGSIVSVIELIVRFIVHSTLGEILVAFLAIVWCLLFWLFRSAYRKEASDAALEVPYEGPDPEAKARMKQKEAAAVRRVRKSWRSVRWFMVIFLIGLLVLTFFATPLYSQYEEDNKWAIANRGSLVEWDVDGVKLQLPERWQRDHVWYQNESRSELKTTQFVLYSKKPDPNTRVADRASLYVSIYTQDDIYDKDLEESIPEYEYYRRNPKEGEFDCPGFEYAYHEYIDDEDTYQYEQYVYTKHLGILVIFFADRDEGLFDGHDVEEMFSKIDYSGFKDSSYYKEYETD